MMSTACKRVQPFAPRRGYGSLRSGDLAIDPGTYTGWALFAETFLVACGSGAPPFECAKRSIVELPQVYPAQPVPPNDLVTLAFLAGRYAHAASCASCEVFTIFPHAWKGSLKKEVCQARVRSKLAATELTIVLACDVPEGEMHNVWDAIGIGLYAFRGIKV